MAKKKEKKNWQFYLKQPLSVKQILAVLAGITSLIAVNAYTFTITPARVEAVPAVVSQSDLMNVLGNTVTLGEEKKESYTTFFNKPEVASWQKIVEEKPEYPDAYLMIAILAYNDHNCQLAQSYISNASRLDPISQKIQEAKKVIERCGT
jgi:radical SAM superfamily enzyme with C-terminal helix-hairpin-helix motif